jgi:hypothetical protein
VLLRADPGGQGFFFAAAAVLSRSILIFIC